MISSRLCCLLFVLNIVNSHNRLWWGAIFIHFMAHSGFFSIWKIKSFVLCTLFLELTIFGCWTSFLFSYFYFPSLCPFVLLFDNVPQLYFLILLLANESTFLGNSIIMFVGPTTIKKRAHLLSKGFRPSIKGKWSQTLQRAVVAVRPGELYVHYMCSVWQGLLCSFG